MRRTARRQNDNPILLLPLCQQLHPDPGGSAAIEGNQGQFRQGVNQGKQVIICMFANLAIEAANPMCIGNDIPQSYAMFQ